MGQQTGTSAELTVGAGKVLRGIHCLAAFSLMAIASWGQQPLSRVTTGPVRASQSDQFRQLNELSSGLDQPNSATGRAMQPPSQTCLLEPYPGLSNTVSVRSLAVPEKAQNEYQRACNALLSKKVVEAEKHLRKALQYSSDALGWVMLGKILEATDRWDEAGKACTEAVVRDPYYWPADVCVAEIDVDQRKWKEAVEVSNRALSLNPISKKFAYYISAIALYNLNQISDAESRALEVEKLDGDHDFPALQIVLARIDEVKGNLRAAETRLRNCLKNAKDSLVANLAKQELTQLGSSPN
jgi:tetratricopeptide (TPR) repeat protein